jgi:hypothetical protein
MLELFVSTHPNVAHMSRLVKMLIVQSRPVKGVTR